MSAEKKKGISKGAKITLIVIFASIGLIIALPLYWKFSRAFDDFGMSHQALNFLKSNQEFISEYGEIESFKQKGVDYFEEKMDVYLIVTTENNYKILVNVIFEPNEPGSSALYPSRYEVIEIQLN